MGIFSKKKGSADGGGGKAMPAGVGAQAVSGPGDLEDPPLVEAWVVPDHPVTTASASNTKAYPPTAAAVGAHAISQPAPGLVVMPPPGAPSGVVSLPENGGGSKLDRRVNPRPDDAVYGQSFKRKPMQMDACPRCHHTNGRTRVRTYPTLLTWLSVLALLLLFWPLAWVPLVW
eukprot:CAMPEP_0178535658 /NCGR_PEP_ID=MMETSP0696-20121128/35660_1 /TAXON_ID=265572 /ORGANISM="Extubocellulus spinifer, Strain CCMP396" /LENGTH=172 /DNA_ID=CAMNT_0020167807 /DNA_START=50 /DNA_END=565 /DNA_ORIENTATION=-